MMASPTFSARRCLLEGVCIMQTPIRRYMREADRANRMRPRNVRVPAPSAILFVALALPLSAPGSDRRTRGNGCAYRTSWGQYNAWICDAKRVARMVRQTG